MKNIAYLLLSLQLVACGFKGDLYLPKENDDAKFGAIQTGIDFKRTPTNPTEKNNENLRKRLF
ncbi:LPS translocon maturation chaperone LptM [Kingella kingae]|uniref:LPS translocon maturation chaperone LptM n=1 Tax=Kingella kingae TaxID=504 RepID=UPI000416534D|nr:lipoprotein [Kingella kingae]